MKSLLLITFSFYSLNAMHKESQADKEVQQIHEKVKSIRELQTNDINLIAARINAEFYTAVANFENPTASMLMTEKQTIASVTVAIEDILEAKIKESTDEMTELLRKFTEAQTALKDLQKKKKVAKKNYTEFDNALERAHYITAQQATHNITKKSAEITYYWSILLERNSKRVDKVKVKQDA